MTLVWLLLAGLLGILAYTYAVYFLVQYFANRYDDGSSCNEYIRGHILTSRGTPLIMVCPRRRTNV